MRYQRLDELVRLLFSEEFSDSGLKPMFHIVIPKDCFHRLQMNLYEIYGTGISIGRPSQLKVDNLFEDVFKIDNGKAVYEVHKNNHFLIELYAKEPVPIREG